MFDQKAYQKTYRREHAEERREYQRKYYASEVEKEKKRKKWALLQEARKERLSVEEWEEEKKRRKTREVLRKKREAQARYRQSIRPHKEKVISPIRDITVEEIKETMQTTRGVLAELEAKLAQEKNMNRLKRRHAPEPGAWQEMIKTQGDTLVNQINDERVSSWWSLHRDDKKKNYAALQRLRVMSRSDSIKYDEILL